MKLYYSGNSPYARRPRMAIRQFGLTDQVEEVTRDALDAADQSLQQFGRAARCRANDGQWRLPV